MLAPSHPALARAGQIETVAPRVALAPRPRDSSRRSHAERAPEPATADSLPLRSLLGRQSPATASSRSRQRTRTPP